MPMKVWVLSLVISAVGYLLSFILANPWFLMMSFYIAPVCRFRSFKSFSLGICDCTFNTEDGVLHMALGPLVYLLICPFLLVKVLQGKP